MSAKPHRPGPAREVIAPPHVSLRQEVGREAGPTPLEYGEVRLWLVAKGPLSLFSYWEFRPDEHPEAIGADGNPHFYLRIIREGDGVESTNEIDPAAGNLTTAANEADASYLSEIGFYNAKGVWCFLARSNPARTGPAEQLLLIAPSEKKNEPDPMPAKKWSRAQEKRLNRILAAEIAQHRGPQKRRGQRANAQPRRTRE